MGKARSVSLNDDWQTGEDLQTLCRAKEIQRDPKRMAKCQEMAKGKMLEMAAVAGKDKE